MLKSLPHKLLEDCFVVDRLIFLEHHSSSSSSYNDRYSAASFGDRQTYSGICAVTLCLVHDLGLHRGLLLAGCRIYFKREERFIVAERAEGRRYIAAPPINLVSALNLVPYHHVCWVLYVIINLVDGPICLWHGVILVYGRTVILHY